MSPGLSEPPKPSLARAPGSVSPAPPRSITERPAGDLKLAPTSGTCPAPPPKIKLRDQHLLPLHLLRRPLPSLGAVSAGEEAGSGLCGRLLGRRELALAPCPLRGGTGGMEEPSPAPPGTPPTIGRRSQVAGEGSEGWEEG